MTDRAPSVDSPPTHEPNYRAEIDGLRAFAVLAVVGFHTGISWLAGGFVGVDVFFVISGYLISGIVVRALEKGTFTFTQFYTRRINRIVPALLVVLAATAIIGWTIMYAGEFRNLGKHIAGSSAFISNFLLWSEAGYFDSALKPLLHLWSLAVEEQFYLAWPLTLVLAWKSGRRIGWVVTAGVVISFALAIVLIAVSQAHASFYFPFTRFWEILAGAALNHVKFRRPGRPWDFDRYMHVAANVAAVAGVLLLVLAVTVANESIPWPGWWALAPVGGTVLLIAAGPGAWINANVFATRPMVALGLISYPFYLWHWPLIVAAKLATDGNPGRGLMAGVVAASIALAFATYRYVELPIRFGKRKRRSAAILLPLLAAVGLIGLLMQRGVIRSRLDRTVGEVAQRADADYVPSAMFRRMSDELGVVVLPGDSTHTVAVFGDSHMMQYWPRIVELNRSRGRESSRVLMLTYGGCPPFDNVNRTGRSWDGAPWRCEKFYRSSMRHIDGAAVKTVVIGAWWEDYLEKRFLHKIDDRTESKIGLSGPATDSLFASFEIEVARLRRAGKRVFIVLSNPTSPAYAPTSVLPARIPGSEGRQRTGKIDRAEFEARVRPTMDRLRAIAKRTGSTTIDPVDALCDRSACATTTPDGVPIYRDYHHLRASYARRAATFIDQVLDKD